MNEPTNEIRLGGTRSLGSHPLRPNTDAHPGAPAKSITTPATQTPATETPDGLGAPDLFSSLNYRTYLAQWFAARKKLQSGYSAATFAKKARLQSHSHLGMVIRGERNLSADSTRAFIRALGLKSREALYFEKLVLFNQARDSEDRAYYFEQLCSISQGASRVLITKIKDHAAYLSHWYIAAIREMVNLEDFQADAEWISRKLKKKISKKEAQEAWELLLQLGMVKEENGRFAIVHPELDIDPGTIDFAIRNYHKEYLERAKEAIDGEPIEERELSSLTLSVSGEDFALLKERIKEFRKKLNTEFPVSQSPRKRVVAINLQALVLTESSEKNSTENKTTHKGRTEK